MQFRNTKLSAMAMILLLGALVPGPDGQANAGASDTGSALLLAPKPFIAQAKTSGGITAQSAARTLISEPVIAPRGWPVTRRHAGLDFTVAELRAGLVQTWRDFAIWLRDTYARQPVVAILLVALLLLPLLALPGLLGGRNILKKIGSGRPAIDKGAAQSDAMRGDWAPPPLPGPAWIRIEGDDGKAMRISGEMLRIGRESDNDVCLGDRSVHRYHALIHRTSDAEFCVTDLSGDNGNGMFVNGVKLRAAILGSGDHIQLGMVGLRFEQGQA